MLASLCCCFKSRANDRKDEAELSNKTNPDVICKQGLYGNDVHLTVDHSNNYIKVAGKGIALGSSTLDCDTAYWEVRIGKNPMGVKVGIKRFNIKKPADLSGLLDDQLDNTDSDSPQWYFKGPELNTGNLNADVANLLFAM